MALGVTSAFNEFMKNEVNLDEIETKKARASRDNLVNNIFSFSGDDDFFIIIGIPLSSKT